MSFATPITTLPWIIKEPLTPLPLESNIPQSPPQTHQNSLDKAHSPPYGLTQMANQLRYPLRGAHGAPAFDGVPMHLNRYFEDIDIVLTGINPDTPEADLIQYAKHYLDTDTCLLWETLTPEPHPEWT